jgi:hypothetical protein
MPLSNSLKQELWKRFGTSEHPAEWDGFGGPGNKGIRFGGQGERCGGKAGIGLVVEEEDGCKPEVG